MISVLSIFVYFGAKWHCLALASDFFTDGTELATLPPQKQRAQQPLQNEKRKLRSE